MKYTNLTLKSVNEVSRFPSDFTPDEDYCSSLHQSTGGAKAVFVTTVIADDAKSKSEFKYTIQSGHWRAERPLIYKHLHMGVAMTSHIRV